MIRGLIHDGGKIFFSFISKTFAPALGTTQTLTNGHRTWNFTCYNKNYQQLRLFVLCLYLLFLVFSLHVSGFHEPIIRSISSCCFYATIWFMQCFVDRLRTSADWFVVVTSVHRSHHHKPVHWRTQTINKALHEPNGSVKTTAWNTPDDGLMKARKM